MKQKNKKSAQINERSKTKNAYKYRKQYYKQQTKRLPKRPLFLYAIFKEVAT